MRSRPRPSTVNRQPSTLNPQPSTLNPNLSTLNSSASALYLKYPQPSPIPPRPSPFILLLHTFESYKVQIIHPLTSPLIPSPLPPHPLSPPSPPRLAYRRAAIPQRDQHRLRKFKSFRRQHKLLEAADHQVRVRARRALRRGRRGARLGDERSRRGGWWGGGWV